jgi:hypothetical protein
LVITGTNFTATGYYTVATITGTNCTVTGNTVTYLVPPTTWTGSFVPVLVFDHGHPLEIVNNVKQYSESDILKYESFPRICLLHDFEEKITFEKTVTVDIIIVTDTDPAYTAPQRYTYSFDPILTPLYNLFMAELAASDYIVTTEKNYFKHTKIDRLFWGKNGLYGNTGNIFNDYIDAIEINKLELIINNC